MIALKSLAVTGAGPYTLDLAGGAVLGLLASRGDTAQGLLEALGGARRHQGLVLVRGKPRRAGDVAYAPAEVEQILFGRTAAEAIGPRGQAYAARLAADHLLERSPQELSSGERRRLALAAVFGSGRPLLLFDRPTAGLDPQGQELFWRAAAEQTGVIVLTLVTPVEARHCSGILAVPGTGELWPGGAIPAERQRLAGWPPDQAADLAWTLGIKGDAKTLAEEVAAWRAGRRPR